MIKISVDPRDKEAIAIAIVMLTAALGPVEVKQATEAPVKPASKKTVTKAEAPAPEVVKEMVGETPAPQEEAVSLDMLRTLLAEKVDKNRDAILAKVQEFKAKNLTTLEPVHYPAMYHFLKGLK